MLLLPMLVLLAAECIPMADAPGKIGETTCVKAKVLKVVTDKDGANFLDFCVDFRTCPFSVVIFTRDLRDVGNIRLLEGKDIEIHGKIAEHKGRAQIILRDKSQLRGQAAKPPPMPRDYDAERKGQFKAGEFKRPKRP